MVRYSGIQRDITGYSWIHVDTVEYSGMQWDIVGYRGSAPKWLDVDKCRDARDIQVQAGYWETQAG